MSANQTNQQPTIPLRTKIIPPADPSKLILDSFFDNNISLPKNMKLNYYDMKRSMFVGSPSTQQSTPRKQQKFTGWLSLPETKKTRYFPSTKRQEAQFADNKGNNREYQLNFDSYIKKCSIEGIAAQKDAVNPKLEFGKNPSIKTKKQLGRTEVKRGQVFYSQFLTQPRISRADLDAQPSFNFRQLAAQARSVNQETQASPWTTLGVSNLRPCSNSFEVGSSKTSQVVKKAEVLLGDSYSSSEELSSSYSNSSSSHAHSGYQEKLCANQQKYRISISSEYSISTTPPQSDEIEQNQYKDGNGSFRLSSRSDNNNLFVMDMFKKKNNRYDNLIQFERASNLSQSLARNDKPPIPKPGGRKLFPPSQRLTSSLDQSKENRLCQQESRQNLHRSQRERCTKIEDFVIGKKLGKGKFGYVYVAKHRLLGFVVALKVIPKSIIKQNNLQGQLERQLKVQFYLQHFNIAQLYGYFADAQNFYLILELCLEGQLYDQLKEKKRLSEPQAAEIVSHVVEGVDYLQRNSVIHRDIKPENIILQFVIQPIFLHFQYGYCQGVPKLCDFGWAVYNANAMRQTFCGTASYAAPELLKGEKYSDKIDVWAIGILTYEILVGRIPFRLNSHNDLTKIINEDIKFPEYAQVSDTAKEFIQNILRKNPEDRYEVDDILHHKFLRNRASSPFSGELEGIFEP